jgi:hypothetical protein
MVSIESEEENEFIFNFTKKSLPQVTYLWIGAKRTGSGLSGFEWENGSPFSYSNWMPSQPNSNRTHVYIGMRGTHLYSWAVWDKYHMNFICEKTTQNHPTDISEGSSNSMIDCFFIYD